MVIHTKQAKFTNRVGVLVEKKSAKIMLVNPPIPPKTYQHVQFPLIGLAYMAAILEKHGHEVTVIDCPALKLTHEDLKREIAKLQSDIVGVSSVTVTFPSALKAASAAKEACPSALTVLGGPHVTVLDEQTLSENKDVDCVARHECEYTILELANHVSGNPPKNLDDIEGITFRKNGQIVRTPDRAFIQDLDSLPRPAYKFFALEKYRYLGKLVFPIMASRGCPGNCAFCPGHQMSGRVVRKRSPKYVVDEIEWLRDKLGADAFTFYDPTFTFDNKWVWEICEELQKRKINLSWDCTTRVDYVSKPILAKMKQANCQIVGFGIESNSQKILNIMRKGTTTEQNERAVRWAKEVGLPFGLFIIIGYPGETAETFKETLDFIRKAHPDDVYVSFPAPYPKTLLYELVKKNGWKLSSDWSRFDNITPVFENPSMPAKAMIEARIKIFNEYYSPSNIIRQTLKGTCNSKLIARTAINYQLQRIKLSKLLFVSLKRTMSQQNAMNHKQTGTIKTEKPQFETKS
jgi:anaerobic magnesium-protoporphyrin IX monomethyl ester cyclase